MDNPIDQNEWMKYAAWGICLTKYGMGRNLEACFLTHLRISRAFSGLLTIL